MEMAKRLNDAIDYIEENLADDIDMHEAARRAGCSAWQFQRMFCYIAEMPLSEYVRRRRLSHAALELSHGQARVIDVGLRHGYDSPTAFTRAFKFVFGISPSEAREPGASLATFPRIVFTASVTGGDKMKYQIREMSTIRAVGEVALHGLRLGRQCEGEAAGVEQVSAFWAGSSQQAMVERCAPFLTVASLRACSR